MSDLEDKMLDDLFAAARSKTPDPSPDFLARVMADAQALQPDSNARLAPAEQPRASLWQSLMTQIGGWPAVAGLASAAVTGLWIGISPPDVLDMNMAALLGTDDTIELFAPASGFDFSQFEG